MARLISLLCVVGGVVLLSVVSHAMDQTKITYQCSGGWRYKEFSCYFFSGHKTTWHDARRYCQGYCADLVKISSEEESEDFNGYLKDVTWLGLNDIVTEGDFKWISDNSQPDYNKWRMADSVTTNDKGNCAVTSKDLQWDVADCSSTQLFACEKPAYAVKT